MKLSDLPPFERGAAAARRGIAIFGNPYFNHRDYHTVDWWRGHRSITGEAELPDSVITGFDDRTVLETADAGDDDAFDDVAAIGTLLRTAA